MLSTINKPILEYLMHLEIAARKLIKIFPIISCLESANKNRTY
jgi:hypothetical protein